MSSGDAVQTQDTVPIKTIFAVYLVIFIVLWVVLPLASWSDAHAVGFLLSISLAVALLAAVLTLTAPSWVLTFLGLVGLISVGIGIYLGITVPEGILIPMFVVIGGGVLLVEIVVTGNRYWRGRHQHARS